MNNYYIVLSHSNTLMARVVRIFTGAYWNHTSLALSGELNEFYSFGRKNPRLLFPAGFISEGVHTGYFGLKPKTKIAVYEAQMTDEEYGDMLTKLDEFRLLGNDAWSIHDVDHATLRVAPNSTYKIYAALFGLEEGVITPENTFIAWDGNNYPFDTWNNDQNLQSAMSNSVNWYFQTVDEQLGVSDVYSYIKEIGYGNENMSGDFSSFWMESSLKISPIEQVELLTKLQNNSFNFAPENINAIKDSICLSSSDAGTFYGKTGTGHVNGQDVNGWFVGLLETANNTYFFATNIGADTGATGSNATEITMSILSDMNIWIQ